VDQRQPALETLERSSRESKGEAAAFNLPLASFPFPTRRGKRDQETMVAWVGRPRGAVGCQAVSGYLSTRWAA
jgi:hypothetical protein